MIEWIIIAQWLLIVFLANSWYKNNFWRFRKCNYCMKSMLKSRSHLVQTDPSGFSVYHAHCWKKVKL